MRKARLYVGFSVKRHNVGAYQGARRDGTEDLQDRSDQAFALRRRRLRDPVVASDDRIEQPRQRLRLVRRMRRATSAWTDVDIDVDGYDECNTVIDVKRTVAKIRAADGGFVGLVGVQSNQYPRALDLAREFRVAGITVVMGGFHVSGCISMLPNLPPDLQEALDLGVTLFAGEGEGRMDEFLRDIAAGTLKPIYNYLSDLPEMADATLLAHCRPVRARRRRRRRRGDRARQAPVAPQARAHDHLLGCRDGGRCLCDGAIPLRLKRPRARSYWKESGYSRNQPPASIAGDLFRTMR